MWYKAPRLNKQVDIATLISAKCGLKQVGCAFKWLLSKTLAILTIK